MHYWKGYWKEAGRSVDAEVAEFHAGFWGRVVIWILGLVICWFFWQIATVCKRGRPSSLTRFINFQKQKIFYLSRKNINGEDFSLTKVVWFTIKEVVIFVLWFSENSSNFTFFKSSFLLSFLINNYWQLLRPEEVEILVCGSPELDMHALQRSTQYDGYAKTDLTIRWALWTWDREDAEEGVKGCGSFVRVTYTLWIK